MKQIELQEKLQKNINEIYKRYNTLSDAVENGHVYDEHKLEWIKQKANELIESCEDIIESVQT